MLCAVVFTNIESIFTFVLIMIMDMLVNLYYCVLILSAVNKDLHRRVSGVASRGRKCQVAAAPVDPKHPHHDGDGGEGGKVRAFLASAGLAKFSDKLIDYGVESVADLGDTELLTDANLMSSVGLKKMHVKKLRRALVEATAAKENDAKASTNALNQEQEQQHEQQPVANPRVAYLCANLYFAEMTEIIGPLVMGALSLIIYYLVPQDTYMHVTYMDPRVGASEARFLQGMGYVLVDAVVEAGSLAVLVAYMRRAVGVDPMRVGWYCVTRHRAYFFWIHLTMGIVFVCMFLRHTGHDTAFQFRWLASDFEYDPGNTTAATALLWT